MCLHQDKEVAFFTLPAFLQLHNILVGTEPLSCEFLGEEFDAKKPLGWSLDFFFFFFTHKSSLWRSSEFWRKALP